MDKKWLVAGPSIIYILLSCISFYFLYNSPVAGVKTVWDRKNGQWVVESSESWSRLRKGDVIEYIGSTAIGRPGLISNFLYLKTRQDVFAWLRAKRDIYNEFTDHTVVFGVRRGKAETGINLNLRKAGLSFAASAEMAPFFEGFIFLAIGIIVFYKTGTAEQSVVFFLLCFCYALNSIFYSSTKLYELAIVPSFLFPMNFLNALAYSLGAALMLHFSLLIPSRKRLIDLAWTRWVLYGSCLAVFFSFYVNLIHVYTIMVHSLALVSFIYSFIAAKTTIEKQQMKWIVFGFGVLVPSIVLLSLVPQLLTGRQLIDVTFTSNFLVFIPLTMAFAIQKYGLMDIDRLMEGTFVYVVTVLTLGVFDLGFISLASDKFGESASGHPVVIVFFSSMVIMSLYASMRDRIRRFLRRLFRRDAVSEGAVISSFTDSAAGQPPESIIELFRKTICGTFRPEPCIVVKRGDPESEEIFDMLDGRVEPLNMWQQSFKEYRYENIYVALPFGKGKETECALLLGELPERRFYSRDDMNIMRSILKQARILYENAFLYDDNIRHCRMIIEEEKRHILEKEKILRDLHDGIGGIMTNIKLLSEIANNSSSLPEMKKALGTVSELSKEGLSEIRGFMRTLDGKDATWQSLTAEFRNYGVNMVGAHGIKFDMKTSIDPGAEDPGTLLSLNLFRIYKEALTNIVKHSGAKSVAVKMDIEVARLIFRIIDDGEGLKEVNSSGRGISNMKSRAAEIGGNLSLSRNGGTVLSLEIPPTPKIPR
jgi:signal transduction histidine kinase